MNPRRRQQTGWFKVYSEILHDPKIRAGGRDSLSTYIAILAMLAASRSEDGILDLDETTLKYICMTNRRDTAERILDVMASTGALLWHDRGMTHARLARNKQHLYRVEVSKWPERQGSALLDRQTDKTDKKESSKGAEPRAKRRARRPPAAGHVSATKGKITMPMVMPAESMDRLVGWAESKGYRIGTVQGAVERVSAWHRAEGSAAACRLRTLRGWEQTVRNGIEQGWARPESRGTASGRVSDRMETDRLKYRADLKAQVNAEADERAHRFPATKGAAK